MIVVSNTSPILNLARVRQLAMLETLYERVIIPEAVARELAAYLGSCALSEMAWLEVRPPGNLRAADVLVAHLDPGEAEAIAMALDLGADLLLIDERLGRQTARHLGLHHTGLLGVLIEAKSGGLVSAVGPVLDDLTRDAGFWVSPRLRAHILAASGE